MKLAIKTRYTGIATLQARETGAPWTYTSVYDTYYLLLILDKLGGFQSSKQKRQELPGVIFQSVIVLF